MKSVIILCAEVQQSMLVYLIAVKLSTNVGLTNYLLSTWLRDFLRWLSEYELSQTIFGWAAVAPIPIRGFRCLLLREFGSLGVRELVIKKPDRSTRTLRFDHVMLT